MDRYLDEARCGPRFLAQEEIALAVVESIQRGVLLGHYELGAFVIMANHMHLLILPKIDPSQLLKSLKGSSARQANVILGRTGERFWRAESYDHWVRDQREWDRISDYIEQNPVKAGFAESAENYRWSSGWKSVEMSLDAANTSVCATTTGVES